jgi:hypothetical protein
VPKNAQGYAASMIAKGAGPTTLFAALVQEPPQDVAPCDTEPATADLNNSAPVEGNPVASAPVEDEPAVAAQAEGAQTTDAPAAAQCDPALDLADAARTDDEASLHY